MQDGVRQMTCQQHYELRLSAVRECSRLLCDLLWQRFSLSLRPNATVSLPGTQADPLLEVRRVLELIVAECKHLLDLQLKHVAADGVATLFSHYFKTDSSFKGIKTSFVLQIINSPPLLGRHALRQYLSRSLAGSLRNEFVPKASGTGPVGFIHVVSWTFGCTG